MINSKEFYVNNISRILDDISENNGEGDYLPDVFIEIITTALTYYLLKSTDNDTVGISVESLKNIYFEPVLNLNNDDDNVEYIIDTLKSIEIPDVTKDDYSTCFIFEDVTIEECFYKNADNDNLEDVLFLTFTPEFKLYLTELYKKSISDKRKETIFHE